MTKMVRFVRPSLALGGLLLLYSLNATLAWSALLLLAMVATGRLRRGAGPAVGRSWHPRHGHTRPTAAGRGVMLHAIW